MANKVMQIQQWVAEVKNLEMMEDDSTPNMSSNNTRSAAAAAAATAAASTAAIAAGEARYAIMKELLSRKEELEAPLEDDDDADEEQVASGSGKKKGGGKAGKGGGAGDEGVDKSFCCPGMESVYEEAVEMLSVLENEAEAVEMMVDTWFDDHVVSLRMGREKMRPAGFISLSSSIFILFYFIFFFVLFILTVFSTTFPSMRIFFLFPFLPFPCVTLQADPLISSSLEVLLSIHFLCSLPRKVLELIIMI